MTKVLIALKMAGTAGREKLSGIFRRLGDDHDWETLLVRTEKDFTFSRFQSYVDSGLRGCIISMPLEDGLLRKILSFPLPMVLVDIDTPGNAKTGNIAFVGNSGVAIGNAAARELLSLQRCKSFAYVDAEASRRWSADRIKGFSETLGSQGQSCRVISELDELTEMERPIGILAANDDRANSVLDFCRENKIKVPQDALIVGINNDEMICEHSKPKLTSVHPDYEEEGFLAADLMISMLDKRCMIEELSKFVGVEKIVRRESTSNLSPAEILVMKAERIIEKKALQGITADDVAKELHCSRRLLDMRFHESRQESIGERISATKLSEVRRLLLETGDSISTIAARCGYDNPNYLMTLFRKRYNTTMRQFRLKSQHCV